MGMYVEAFLMTPALDRVARFETTYRTSFWRTYGEAEGVTKIPLPPLLRGDVDAPWGAWDNEHAWVMSVARYLELAQQYRDKMNSEAGPDDGPMYVDGMTEWLAYGKPWDDFVIVLVPEE